MTARVDYVESVDSAVCGEHAVSYFGASFGIIMSFKYCMYVDVYLCCQESFSANIVYPTGSCFSIVARKNRRGSAALCLPKYILVATVLAKF